MSSTMQRKPTAAGRTYTYSSNPRPLRGCYRRDYVEEPSSVMYGNLMYDRRVVRGNTYALPVLPATVLPDPTDVSRMHAGTRRAKAKSRVVAAQQDTRNLQALEPPEEREHIEIQTELYIEELADRIEEFDVGCQTDEMLDRPPTPPFVPAKTGIDEETQVYDGDLFNFDIEVVPIVEVFVGKTMEQSLLEVLEEEELANLRQQQRVFDELRNAEMAEHERLEEQERRLREEKAVRIKQQQEIAARERETIYKMAAHAFAHRFLDDLVPSVYKVLSDGGYFHDPVEREVEMQFLPWLMNTSLAHLRQAIVARHIIDELLRSSLTARLADMEWLDAQFEFVKTSHDEAVCTPVEPPYPYFFTEADWLIDEDEDEEEEEEEVDGETEEGEEEQSNTSHISVQPGDTEVENIIGK